ncbi:uncharacterized protein LOC117102881 isoform X2 [Anneissia japonica]|uniref:uncharacterized protein LOC117102881 isoform X2 n=1 Tax=Anneissia japonica TaxID=1529436 RepID=UPI001425738D|nr:uncharacterized protein LOC117102881 isoform X2 [Anneissia japonica]
MMGSNRLEAAERWFKSPSAETDKGLIKSSVFPKEKHHRRSVTTLPPMTDDLNTKTARGKIISQSIVPGIDGGDNHLKGKRRISQESNHMIVTHLRRKLRQRMNQWYDDTISLSDDETSSIQQSQIQSPVKSSSRQDIFHKYNDIGGRLSKEGHAKDGLYPVPQRLPSENVSLELIGKFGKHPDTKMAEKLRRVSDAGLRSSVLINGNRELVTINAGLDKRLSMLKNANFSIDVEKRDVKDSVKLEPLHASTFDVNFVSKTPSDGTQSTASTRSGSSRKRSSGTDRSLSPVDFKNYENNVSFPGTPIKLPAISSNVPPTNSEVLLTATMDNDTGRLDDDVLEEDTSCISPVPEQYPYILVTEEANTVECFDWEDAFHRILKGNVNIRCPVETKIIQIYLSSTFPDFIAERTSIIGKAVPRLKQYCRDRGFEFQLRDHNWGLKDTNTDDHSHTKLCLKELKSCQRLSKGPNYVLLLGQKYGQCPLPSVITAWEYRAIIAGLQQEKEFYVNLYRPISKTTTGNGGDSLEVPSQNSNDGKGFVDSVVAAFAHKVSISKQDESQGARSRSGSFNATPSRKTSQTKQPQIKKGTVIVEDLENDVKDEIVDDSKEKAAERKYDADINLVNSWYKLDENSLPHVYRLQCISSQFKDFCSPDKQKKQRALNQWRSIQKKLQDVIGKFVKSVLTDQDRIREFNTSVVEREAQQAVLNPDIDTTTKVQCFQRRFENLKQNLQDFAAKEYTDLLPMKAESDPVLTQKAEELIDNKILQKLSLANLHTYTISWDREGINPDGNRNHKHYLDKLANEFHDSLKMKIEPMILSENSSKSEMNQFYEELSQHIKFIYHRSNCFFGFGKVLSNIKEYLCNTTNQLLILHGKAGCGKSSLMAKASLMLPSWTKGSKLAIVVRFIGATADSEMARCLLRGMCIQISNIYDLDSTTIPEDYFGLINDFAGRIQAASYERPLVIFIDGLHQMSPENITASEGWLPKDIPPNVHIVLSSADDASYTTFKSLKKQFPSANFLQVPDLSEREISTILYHHLSLGNRTLTEEQQSYLIDCVLENPTHLYLEMAIREALKWKSYSLQKETRLGSTSKKQINAFFLSLEQSIGEPVVRRAIGYLTASKCGLTDNEMEDLLSLDEAVMDDIVSTNGTPLHRLPPAIWSRMKELLNPYLTRTTCCGLILYRWAYHLFKEVATERYLLSKDKAPSYHLALAEYFSGKWADTPKPCKSSEQGKLRFVDSQLLAYESNLSPGSGVSKKYYNFRKLHELPYHLLNGKRIDILKSDVLVNFEWTLAKIKGMSLRDVLDDLQSGLASEPNDLELRLISETLQLSAIALRKNPNQLASQLIGRLHNIILNDKPMSIGDPKKYPLVGVMLGQAGKSSTPALIPSITCLTPPGGVLYDLLAGHTDFITALTTTTDGLDAVTASRDGTLKLWDLRSRKVSKTIENVGKQVDSLHVCMNNLFVVTTEAMLIRIWNIHQGICIKVIDEFIDPAIITSAGIEQQYLVAFFNGSNVMRSWDLTDDYTMIQEIKIQDEAIHKDGSLCLSKNPCGEKVFFAFRSDNKARVLNAKTGAMIHCIRTTGESASITALGVSRDYYIIACRYQYMKLSEIYHLELYDNTNGNYLRSIKGCTQDTINELCINKMGSHALSLCYSAQSNATDVAVFNLETDDHKHLARHAQVSTMGTCVNLSYCLTASKRDKALRIWNFTKYVNDRESGDNKNKKRDGVAAIVPMIGNPRYVVAKTINNGPLSVWNVVKGKCADKAVRIERGLVDQHDIVLIRNNKAVILSDKGMSTVSDKQQFVFQTVFMYDLRLKKYLRKLNQVFIVPSPAHEYRLLEGDLLMGMSENRDHLIVWNLENGHIKYRIKTKFRELERQRVLNHEEGKPTWRKRREMTAKMLPWDRRTETTTARQKRKDEEMDEEKKRIDDLKKEKENAIGQFIMSRDEQVIVCSYFAHHMCVFDVETQTHTQTLENENSMLFLYHSSMTSKGTHLVHANYDDQEKVSYITLWDLDTGKVKKRLKNEPNVCCIGLNDLADRVLFGNDKNILKIWDVRGRKSKLRKLKTPGLELTLQSKVFMIEDGKQAVVFSNDVTLWDLDNGSPLAMFSPDIRITCVDVVMEGNLIVMGLYDTSDIVTLRLKGRNVKYLDFKNSAKSQELFGETTGDTTDEDSSDSAADGSTGDSA